MCDIETSVGGFFEVPGSSRVARPFNVGWRFCKGDADGAEAAGFDDSRWPVVNVPHGLEILPLEASGGINYQGPAWYRKRFEVPADLEGQRVVLHFEGLMGKSKVWVNGQLLKKHFGGYLPCMVDVSAALEYGRENLVAVWVDNSDDPAYPPGKPQGELDFAYFGGLYRDVWLVSTGKVHITDPNEVDLIAGGGVFVHYEDVSASQATVWVETHLANKAGEPAALGVEMILQDGDGREVARDKVEISLAAGKDGTVKQKLVVVQPHLWHVDDPYLHDLTIRVTDEQGRGVDAVRLKTGLRSIEFRGKDGFFLNGQPFAGKLIGTNRHQDYAYVGNAVSNQAHWRDAVKLREAGMRVIRCAHYPQDPAFMDACDALGMFVIITTPGWQFWSKDPVFEQRVFMDIRNMVRRDRNRPSAWLWEPILNETNYPGYFAERVHQITHEEYPHPGCYTACDGSAVGQEHFDVVYRHVMGLEHGLLEKTVENMNRLRFNYTAENRCVFTREWGDFVDNWSAQSSPSRVSKAWGEHAQLVQAEHYADPAKYCYTSYESLCATPAQHVGGTLWHGTDHQRGYHADAFWGGILDATRQPKYSYYMFKSQVSPATRIPHVDAQPFVHIAHLLHPTSAVDVTVFSNCDEVRLKYNGQLIGAQSTLGAHMPHRPVVFKGLFKHNRKSKMLEAEGLIGGKVVATAARRAWDRLQKLVLTADVCGVPLQADGGDFVPVVARIVDKHGEIIRLTDDTIRFSVEGPAELIGGNQAAINPQKLCWGEAVILVRAGIEPGLITVRAESAHPGVCKPLAAEISLTSMAPSRAQLFCERPEAGARSEPAVATVVDAVSVGELQAKVSQLTAELRDLKVAAVERQQEVFMTGKHRHEEVK